MNLDDEIFSITEFLDIEINDMSPNDAHRLFTSWDADFSPPRKLVQAFFLVFGRLESIIEKYRDLLAKNNVLTKKIESLQARIEELENGPKKKATRKSK